MPVKRVGIAAAVIGLMGGLVAGCSGSSNARLSVASGVAAIGQPSPVTVTGLSPDRTVTVTVTSTDAQGVRWRSAITLRSDARGRLAFDAGTLIADMTPLGASPAGAYFWDASNRPFRVSVGGASATVWRRLAPHPIRSVPVTADGLVGRFFSTDVPGRHSAVLLIGGSEGGQPGPLVPAVLAGYGHPVLALAYFKAPGLAKTLRQVPLEYFATALKWLARQPGVDPKRLIIDGASRGGEGALLLGATYPNLVHGVIARVPSDVVLCDSPGCTTSAWSLHGKPVPFTKDFNNPHPTDEPRAIIPVERIDGPVLLNCGGFDQVWNSCGYAKAVMSRLRGSHFPHQLQLCAGCDHFVGRGIPDEPLARGVPGRLYDADIRAFPKFFAAVMMLLGR